MLLNVKIQPVQMLILNRNRPAKRFMITCDWNSEHKIISGNGCQSKGDIFITIYNCLDCNITKWVQTSFSMMKEKWKDFFLGLYKIKKRTKRIGKIWSISKSRPLKILLSQALYFLWFVLNRLYMRQSVVTISLCCVCAIIGVKCYSFYCLRCWNEELWWERQTYQRGCRAMLWN